MEGDGEQQSPVQQVPAAEAGGGCLIFAPLAACLPAAAVLPTGSKWRFLCSGEVAVAKMGLALSSPLAGKRVATPSRVALCWGQCQVKKHLLDVLTVGSFSPVQGSSSAVSVRAGKGAFTLASSKVLGANAPRLMHKRKWKESDLIILLKY